MVNNEIPLSLKFAFPYLAEKILNFRGLEQGQSNIVGTVKKLSENCEQRRLCGRNYSNLTPQ